MRVRVSGKYVSEDDSDSKVTITTSPHTGKTSYAVTRRDRGRGTDMLWLRVANPAQTPFDRKGAMTALDESILALKPWLYDCQSHHNEKGCRPVEFTPRRLITVGLDDKPIRLIDGNTVTDQLGYATLSYCWGDTLNLCTTKDSLPRFEQEIPMDSLPRTFLDAMRMAQALGIPRIWIDALCIVQDDEQEWQAQAAEMSEIFQGSQLTITASQSSNSSEGCFPVGPGERLGDELVFRTKHNGPSSTARLVHVHSGDARNYPSQYGVVHTRGWALQEQILSPRVVYCFNSGIHWQCRSCYRTQHGVFFKREEILDRERRDRGPSIHPGLEKNRKWCRDTWGVIACNYTGRRFTYHKDIVPAIAGITKYFASALNDVPLLGLWRKTFVQDLFWRRVGKRVRPHTLELPSWSWLGAQGRIQYGFQDQQFHASRYIEHVKLLDWDIKWQGTPHTSLLKAAEVRIHGPTRELQIGPSYMRTRETEGTPHLSVFGERSSRCTGQLDIQEITVKSTYLCLLLCSNELLGSNGGVFSVYESFLILEPA